MEVMRVVVTGTMGAGKSTFIRSVSEIEAVDTDKVATDETALLKHKTTVAMDFGRLQFGPENVLHLYGTPGQERFDFMWDVLIEKAHAYILLVAAHRPHEFRYARRILNFMTQRTQLPMIIGVTHTDCEAAWSSENIAITLGYSNVRTRPPIISLNANDSASVAATVLALVQHYMQQCTL